MTTERRSPVPPVVGSLARLPGPWRPWERARVPHKSHRTARDGQVPYQRGKHGKHRKCLIERLVFSSDHDAKVGADYVGPVGVSVDRLDPYDRTRGHSQFAVRVPVVVLLEGALDLCQKCFAGNALLLPWLVTKPFRIMMLTQKIMQSISLRHPDGVARRSRSCNYCRFPSAG
jgi:hypothetical protein